MKNIILKNQLVLFFLLLGFSQSSYACRCAGKITSQDAYERASIVLIGRVTSLKGRPYEKGGASALIDIQKVWKQSLSTPIEVHTSTSCAFDLKHGEEYLLYLYKGKDEGAYIIRSCQGNRELSKSKNEVQWLEKYAEKNIDHEHAVLRKCN